MEKISVKDKYADPQVVNFWQTLGQQGLQHVEWEMINRYLPATGCLLDIGCGTGRGVLELNRKGYDVTGIDLSLAMLQAGHNLAAEMQLGGANLLALPFADETFTAAVMFFGALQHISGRANRQKALVEIARVIQPDGYLILGLDNLAPALICYTYWLIEKVSNHLSPPTLAGPEQTNAADTTLWGRKAHPLVWHLRGVARTLRWRTWPGLVDLFRYLSPGTNTPDPGDIQVAQFSIPATFGHIYYHIYRPLELIEDAARAGWQLQGYHAGRELSEGSLYPSLIRQGDKQLFFAFVRNPSTNALGFRL